MPRDNPEGGRWRQGEVISNDFKVVRRLGRGGMASVYLVRNIDLGHLAAAKVPHRRFLESRETRQIFSREVQTWIALPKHPHLVQCYFLRENNEIPIVFAEFVPSGSLENWIRKKRIRGILHLLDLATQLAEAMRVAETSGIVHRDLKPSNCLLDAAGKIKVGDFGLAASWEGIAEQQLQRTHDKEALWEFSAGTQSYCSPEQFEGAPVSIATDIWSFAVTLYEMISGRRPGLGPAAPHAIKKYCSLAESRSVPSDVWGFLLDLLDSDPTKRPQSFSVVSLRLRELFRMIAGHEYERQFPDIDETLTSPEKAGAASQSAPHGTKQVDQRHVTASVLAELADQQESARSIRGNLDRDPSGIHGLYDSLSGIANSHRKLGNLQEAISAYSECAEHLQELFRKQQTDGTVIRLVSTLHDRAVCRRQSGDMENAISDYDLCITLFGDRNRPDFGQPLLNLLASTYQNRAMALLKGMRLEDALSDATSAIEILERLVHKEGRIEYAIDLATTLVNRAVIFRNVGDSKRALEDYTAAQELCDRPNASGQSRTKHEVLSLVLINRAALYLASGNARDAKRDSDEVIRLFEVEWQASQDTSARLNLSNAYNNRASVNRYLGSLTEAIRDIGRCRKIRQELVEQDGLTNVIGPLVRSYGSEAIYQLDAGKPYDALATINRGIAVLQSVVQRADRIDLRADLAKLRMLRGTAHASCGQLESAGEDLDAAAHDYRCILDSGSVDVVLGLLEVLLAHVHVALDLSVPDRHSARGSRHTFGQADRQTILSSVTKSLDRLSSHLEVNQLKGGVKAGLAKLSQSVESLHRIDRSREGAAAVALIAQLIKTP